MSFRHLYTMIVASSAVALLALVVVLSGCNQGALPPVARPEIDEPPAYQPAGDAEKTNEAPNAEPNAEPAAEHTAQRPDVPDPAPKPVMPDVLLTETHLVTCLVKVGDALPEAALPDMEGNPQRLADLYGERATVVFFWTGNSAMARTGLGDLGPDIAAPYSGLGVKVVGIAVGESAETAGPVLEDNEVTFINLLDAESALFEQVATEKIPRVYLLDGEGQVRWFDIEYSRSTRRELEQGVRYLVEAND